MPMKNSILKRVLIATIVLLPHAIDAKKKSTKSSQCTPPPQGKHSKKQKVKKDKKNKLIRSMTYDELKETKDRYIHEENFDAALRCLEKMKPICSDLAELHDIMLEYANLLFTTNDFEKAAAVYKEFAKFYPGSKKAEYASYRSILCCFKQIKDAERDQTKTKQTIELAEGFLERATVFTEHANDVHKILAESRDRLFASDASIFKYYISRGNLVSAKKHLEIMKKDFITLVAMAEPKLIELEMNFAQAQNNTALFEEKSLNSPKNFLNIQSLLPRLINQKER